MKDFLKTLKSKIESRDPYGKEAEDKFLTNFREEFKPAESNSIWSAFTVQHAVAACLLVVSTTALYQMNSPQVESQGLAVIQLLENETMLANMDVLEDLEELEEFEDLTDEDWDVLIGDVQ